MAEGVEHTLIAKNTISKRDLSHQFFQLIGHNRTSVSAAPAGCHRHIQA
jgi:hypothetical protein